MRGTEGVTIGCGEFEVLWESVISLSCRQLCTLWLRKKDRGRDLGNLQGPGERIGVQLEPWGTPQTGPRRKRRGAGSS